MLNRTLSLIVSIVAPASALAMLVAGAHPIGNVTFGDRVPCIGLAMVALTLAILCLRAMPSRSTGSEAAMWSGLSLFFVVATFASPHLGQVAVVATLALAAVSTARLLASGPRGAPASSAEVHLEARAV